ncbi:hypothetical protein HHI36_006968, partial [Cryptolaemus montrouzieri]
IGAERIIRNQIDYIIEYRRFRNFIRSVKTYQEAVIHSDYVLLLVRMRLCLKKTIGKNMKLQTDIRKLKNHDIR